MAKPHQRVFAFITALLFLATAVAGSVVVIWQIKKDEEANKSLKDSNSTIQSGDPQQLQSQEGANMLKGTKLENFTPIANSDKLQTTDLKEGTGEAVKAGDTITAHYTGAYSVNGEIFESSKDGGQPATFPLNNVIQGWQQGVPGMKVGGIRRLVIPGALAYGEAPAGYTPGSTDRPMGTLVFDIELVKIGQ